MASIRFLFGQGWKRTGEGRKETERKSERMTMNATKGKRKSETERERGQNKGEEIVRVEI